MKSKILYALTAIMVTLIVVDIAILFYNPGNPSVIGNDYSGDLKKFSSYKELSDFIAKSSSANGRYYAEFAGTMKSSSGPQTASAGAMQDSSSSAGEYSTTNIQVEGVDEPDMVKNDGKYIYTINGQKIIITQAYPADSMRIISEIDINKSAYEIFLNEDKLIVFANDYIYTPYEGDVGIASKVACLGCDRGYSTPKTLINVYDISDRENPVLADEFSVEGNYLDARMIDNYVYVISTKYTYNNVEPPIFYANGVETKTAPTDVYYFDYYDDGYIFTSLMAINLDNSKFDSKVYLTGYTGTVYVSKDNIYLTHQKVISYEESFSRTVEEVYLEILPVLEKVKINEIMSSDKSVYEKSNAIQKVIYDYSNSLSGDAKSEFAKELEEKQTDFEIKISKEREQTVIDKIAIDRLNIGHKASGEVPGYLLNQFSIDEYNENLRVAVTTGHVSRTGESLSLNHLYVLNKDLEIIGKVEDLASGERIYSARFIGDRAYIVTFKKIDPLFVIDVSNPKQPEVLGYLKITGYSDYLQLYDETHIIGIGKETRGGDENFAWYQGVKVSLFDVSDVENPIEVGKIEIGDRGTDSPALNDHKAVLFDKKRNLLVIPISLAEKNSQSQSWNNDADSAYGEIVWQGAYVLNIDLDGISLKGKITHFDNLTEVKYGYAKDEPIGATRTDSQGNIWTKVGEGDYESGEWRGPAEFSSVRNNYEVDNFPGGINYAQNQIHDYKYQIQRSLFMDDMLYTISNSKIKANSLGDLSELNKVELPVEQQIYYAEVY